MRKESLCNSRGLILLIDSVFWEIFHIDTVFNFVNLAYSSAIIPCSVGMYKLIIFKLYIMKKSDVKLGKVLTRSELKNIKGGGALVPGEPTDTDALRKCCRNGTDICSPCVLVSASAVCSPGTTLTIC